MLKLKYLLLTALISGGFLSQSQDFEKANKSNTWFKIGLNAAVPIADLSKTNNFGLGVDISVQFLETKASGIGVKAGYLNYFAKGANKTVGALPLAVMFRYYPESVGWFAGLELGYAFLSGLEGTDGGYFARPQIGLHFDNWNYFGYYDLIVVDASAVEDIHALGLGVTYNLRFK